MSEDEIEEVHQGETVYVILKSLNFSKLMGRKRGILNKEKYDLTCTLEHYLWRREIWQLLYVLLYVFLKSQLLLIYRVKKSTQLYNICWFACVYATPQYHQEWKLRKFKTFSQEWLHLYLKDRYNIKFKFFDSWEGKFVIL